MSTWVQYLPVLPIVVPLIAAATLLLFAETQRVPRVIIAFSATLMQLIAAVTLLYMTTDAVPDVWSGGIGVYAIGSWPAPFGIVLVVDRLSALMLTLNATLALAALVYSFARWDRVGVHYHSLFQFLLMGLNGAFLTGDLFNLFVFFEVLLAASYGLLLHGAGVPRVKAGMHYIAVNLAASLAFLIGVAAIYGVTGTLNMAELGVRWPTLSPGDRTLFEGGAAILGIAFLVKAGAWPLNFWLPTAYAAAGAPVAAVFSILTKVGVYAVLRVGSLLADSHAPLPFGGSWLFGIAIATIIFGIIGTLSARQLPGLVAFSVILSSGTVLAAVGLGSESMIGPALFYLLSSVPASGAFFLLTGMTERIHISSPETADVAPLAPATYGAFRIGEPPNPYSDGEVGIAIPAVMAFLGLGFVCCALLVTGLPPLVGFLAKFTLLSAAFDALSSPSTAKQGWLLIGLLLAGGLAGLIALMRMGMQLFWTVSERTTPRLRIIEAGPVAFLLLLSIGLTIAAGPIMTYTDSAAQMLRAPQSYIDAVLSITGAVIP